MVRGSWIPKLTGQNPRDFLCSVPFLQCGFLLTCRLVDGATTRPAETRAMLGRTTGIITYL